MSKPKNKSFGLYSWYDNESKVCAIFFDNKNSVRVEYDLKCSKVENVEQLDENSGFVYEVDLDIFNCIVSYLDDGDYKAEINGVHPSNFYSFVHKRNKKSYELLVDTNNCYIISNEITANDDLIYYPKYVMDIIIISLIKAGYKKMYLVE